MRILLRLSAMTAALALFGACGGDDGPTNTPTPTITVTTTSATASAARGATTTVPITITRGGGYTGSVTLAASGLPNDVQASFSPASLANGVTSSTLTLSVGNAAAAATTPITITASGSGVSSATATVALTVTAPQPSITLVASPTTLAVTQGATATAGLTLTRTNFSGANDAVNIAVTGLPTGVTASLAPASPLTGTTNATTITFTAAANATTGTSNVTVTATGTGLQAQTQTIALTVNASAQPGFTLSSSSATATATAGQNAAPITVTLARQGGFAGDVALTVTGAPAGVTATLTPTSLTGTTLTSTLNITTTAAAVPGTYTLTIRGNSAGQSERTTTVALTVAAAPGITVGLTPATLSISAGANATSNIAITRVGGLTGDVTLTAEGAPAGVTVAFNPATITGANTTSQLTVNAAANAAPGNYTLTIRAAGTGGISGTLPLAVTVTAAQTIAVAATNVSVAQGATGTSTVTLTRGGGFAGNVNLAVSGLPNGVTGTFNPNPATGTTSTLSLQVGAGVAPATYTGTITASGTGVSNATGTFTLIVTGGTGGGNIAYRFCDQSALPLWFAYRNGATGAWVPVTVGANNTYNFSITQNVGGVAYVTVEDGTTQVNVLYYTAAEFPSFAGQQCVQSPATKSVSGTVAGLAQGQTATVSLGNSASVLQNGGFTIANAYAASTDLIATRGSGLSIDRMIIRRDQNPAPGGTITPTLDFGAAEAFAPATAQFTINGIAGGEFPVAQTIFQTANGGSAFFQNFNLGGGNTIAVTGIPSAQTRAGDLHIAMVGAAQIDVMNFELTSFRAVAQANRDLTARSVTLGPVANAPTFTTLATSPYLRVRVQGAWQTDYAEALGTTLTQSGMATKAWTIAASRGYTGAGGSYDLEIPDFAGLAGFNNSWGLVTGTSTDYFHTVYGSLGSFITPTEGATYRLGIRTGSFTP